MGAYVEANLLPGEVVQYEARLHWIIYVPHVILMFVLIGFVTILAPVIARWTTEMVITNKRVIIKRGLISRQTIEMNIPKIESINVEQSIFGRMLGYGTVVVIGTGGSREHFEAVVDPLAFRRRFTAIANG
jgi:uncharacterized membrane protein YdbT with pleckstrin-like domain